MYVLCPLHSGAGPYLSRLSRLPCKTCKAHCRGLRRGVGGEGDRNLEGPVTGKSTKGDGRHFDHPGGCCGALQTRSYNRPRSDLLGPAYGRPTARDKALALVSSAQSGSGVWSSGIEVCLRCPHVFPVFFGPIDQTLHGEKKTLAELC